MKRAERVLLVELRGGSSSIYKPMIHKTETTGSGRWLSGRAFAIHAHASLASQIR